MLQRAFVYVTDERGFDLAKHSIVSVALSQHEPCDIHVFCYRFTPLAAPEFAGALKRLQANLVFHTISDTAMEQFKTWKHVTTPTLLKPAAVGKVIGGYDRIVYLDNDILVFDNLDVAAIDFGQAPVAAVIDMDLTTTGALRTSTGAEAKTDTGGAYFNAGVLIFDGRNWRESEFKQKYLAALDQHAVACPYKLDCTSIDQCALNSVFENNWVNLPLSYNMQASAKFTPAWQTASVRHYCGGRKVIPVSMLRNDSRDVRYLNEIRRVMGRSMTRFPLLYELPFRLNAAHKYSRGLPIRRFMHAIETQRVAARSARTSTDTSRRLVRS